MTLSSLIKKRSTESFATAIPATSATEPKQEGGTVAKIATVAVANAKEGPATPDHEGATVAGIATIAVANRSEGEAVSTTSSRCWQVHFIDRNPMEVTCVPDMTYTAMLAAYPDAVAIEPLPKPQALATSSMTAEEDGKVRAWLKSIGESDAATIDEVLRECRADASARQYFLKRAAETDNG